MAHGPVIRTAHGSVRGRWDATPGVHPRAASFFHVPYAADPVGALRFGSPEPPAPWTDVLDASAPQREVRHLSDSALHLNVHTPDPAGSLPVLVWIHGGGFVSGAPDHEQLDSGTLGRHGVVLVSISYRLGLDGFGLIPGTTADRGVLDWLAALEWTQREIAAFGGDPTRVTIGGHSAGAGAVLTLLGMPRAQPLFQKAIALSPVLGEVDPDDAARRTNRLARLAGVSADRRGLASLPPARVHELLPRAATARRGLAATAERLEKGLPWGPVIDGALVTTSVREAIASGIGADRPLLIGATDDEFTPAQVRRRLVRSIPPGMLLRRFIPDSTARTAYLLANDQLRRAGSSRLLGRLVSDRICRMLVPEIAGARADAATWAYRFTWPSPVTGVSSHTVDVPFWFDGLNRPIARAQLGRAPQALADAMHADLIGFVRDGEPGWPRWRGRDGVTRMFGDDAADVLSDDAYRSLRPLLHG